MFFGQYEHTIDDKSRLALPARFRDNLVEGVVLAMGLDSNVDIYPRAAWDHLVEARIAPLDPLSHEARDLRRFFFAGAAYESVDKQRRVLVPQNLREHGSLGREVVIAGVFDHLEVWNRETWAERLKGVGGSASNAAERLAHQRV
jgi:MraZ protein